MDTSDASIREGDRVLLTYKGQRLAALDVESRWLPNKALEARHCYGTASLEHPAVAMVAGERGRWYLGGRLHAFELPKRCAAFCWFATRLFFCGRPHAFSSN
jgi:sulfate adenylyltransferase